VHTRRTDEHHLVDPDHPRDDGDGGVIVEVAICSSCNLL
jgi:hypothetical protein